MSVVRRPLSVVKMSVFLSQAQIRKIDTPLKSDAVALTYY
jgi:hypothetical protein